MNINEFKSEWIKNEIDESTVAFAQWFGEHLCDKQDGDRLGRMAMTTSQIRNVFGEVKRIQAKGYSEVRASFLLLRPKIAYAEARVKAKSGKSRIEDFRKVMDKAHLAVTNDKQFQNFVDFLEATLAYHKAAGGRDS